MLFTKAMFGLVATGLSLGVTLVAPGDAKSEMSQRLSAEERGQESVEKEEPVATRPKAGAMDRQRAKAMRKQGESESGNRRIASEKTVGTEQAPSGETVFRGRLPRYYSAVVTPKQRAEIYSIQKGYRARLENLEIQLAELRKREQAEVAAVLDASQLEYVAEQTAKAREGRSAK
ncbi:MAG: hypothetical protein ACE361_05340 [Aureliella sp.]